MFTCWMAQHCARPAKQSKLLGEAKKSTFLLMKMESETGCAHRAQDRCAAIDAKEELGVKECETSDGRMNAMMIKISCFWQTSLCVNVHLINVVKVLMCHSLISDAIKEISVVHVCLQTHVAANVSLLVV